MASPGPPPIDTNERSPRDADTVSVSVLINADPELHEAKGAQMVVQLDSYHVIPAFASSENVQLGREIHVR